MAQPDLPRRAADALSRALELPSGGGPTVAQVLVAALATLLAVEVGTGVLLALTYVPSPIDAWASVFFTQTVVTGGAFLRGLHQAAGHLMLVVLGAHLVALAGLGAYRGTGRRGWWAGLGLLAVLFGLLITGHRLPWDQNTYWALVVEANIAGAMPVVGPGLRKLVLGGSEPGRLSLTRLYVAHALLLTPLAWLLLRATWRSARAAEPRGPRVPVWAAPALGLAVLVGLGGWTLATGGASLGAPAEPDRTFPARPEWFLLFLYELRALAPPSLEIVAVAVVPAVAAAFLVAMPLLDGEGGVSSRVPALFPGVFLLLAAVGLTASAATAPLEDDTRDAYAEAERRRSRAFELAREGIPPGGPLDMLAHDPLTRGRDVYRQYCTSCHVLEGEGERKAPDHTGFASEAWIFALLEAPDAPHFFGETGIDEMPSQSEKGEEALRGAAAFLHSLGVQEGERSPGAAEVERGRALWEDKCMTCHLYEGDGDFLGLGGPDLTGYATVAWIRTQTATPEAHYGELDEMPAFEDQLLPNDLDMVAEYLRLQRFEEPVFPDVVGDEDDG